MYMREEYVDKKGNRLFETKGKYEVYCVDDKTFLVDEYYTKWSGASFPGLINMRYHNPKTDETKDDYCITAMLRMEGILIYGGIDGRIHIVKLESLDTCEDLTEYRISDMCLSRVYSALTTPITELKVAATESHRYLFVGSYGSECVVKL